MAKVNKEDDELSQSTLLLSLAFLASSLFKFFVSVRRLLPRADPISHTQVHSHVTRKVQWVS